MCHINTITCTTQGLNTSMLTSPRTNENTNLRLDPICNHSGHCDFSTCSGCVGKSRAAIQHILTATATTLMGWSL